ncbi:MAG TPA: ectonucleotide pyrophosphatase/phosphodiesterase [Tepidisphaeraceae bacterium]|jgi:predicted AlkP superfamily pyrophosphatase or phosphodiesterase|nr:ectonucleotide pyrophosphatase/phosphodiesterase [Tepidisphaeraceae bacterium]
MPTNLLALLLLTIALFVPTVYAAEKPVPAVEHVVIVSIDGLRPDVALRANMPALRSLLARGSYSFWARTTEMSNTLPSHVSMLTGVTPDHHGVKWNDARSGPEGLTVPTLFEKAKEAGYSTALVASKVKFGLLAKAGAVDSALIPTDDKNNDQESAEAAAELIRTKQPGVLFVHFGEVDGAGHGNGWGTPKQVEVIERADTRLALVIKAIEDAGLTDSTVLILSADHGGAGRSHGANDARSRHIPWIAVGPGIAKNIDLTHFRDRKIDTEDTFATACWLLGIDPSGANVSGKPVTEILEIDELLTPATAPTTAPSAAK